LPPCRLGIRDLIDCCVRKVAVEVNGPIFRAQPREDVALKAAALHLNLPQL
jgi:hypothetical protein